MLFRVVLKRAADLVLVRAEDVGQQQLVSVPIGVERLVEAHLRALAADFAQIHQYLVFDAAAGIGRKLYVLAGIEGVDSLDKPDRADGYQVLKVYPGVLKALRDVDDKAQIVLDEKPARGLVTVVERGDGALLLCARKGRRQCVAAADVKNRRRLYPKDRQDPFVYKHDLWLAKHTFFLLSKQKT